MTIPKYLATFRRAVQELEGYEKNEINEKRGSQPGLNSFNSFNSYPTEPPPFADNLDQLKRRCPEYVEPERWRQCLHDAQGFLAAWGDKALALGWNSDELFGLHKPPARPHPSYHRLSRYDATGLLWLLQGCRVTALSSGTAAVEGRSGKIVSYRKNRKPALRAAR